MRAMCGATRPIKPIGPTKATASAESMLMRSSVVKRSRRTSMPKLTARSSPRRSAVSFHELIIDSGSSTANTLRGNAEVLIFDEPTKGVDIKAKQELFSLIDGLARAGRGVIYASGEFAELIGLCDRICVLWDGRIVAELNAADIDEETLLLYSTGGTPA